MEPDRRWSCNRKKAYPTLKAANEVARSVNEKHGAHVHGYACQHCGLFHIGRIPKTEGAST